LNAEVLGQHLAVDVPHMDVDSDEVCRKAVENAPKLLLDAEKLTILALDAEEINLFSGSL
jgi:hypothetical protein